MTTIPMKTLQLSSNTDDLKRYTEWVQKQSKDRLKRVSESLHEILWKDQEIMAQTAIFTTGSDGRSENKIFDGPKSNTELSIFSSKEASDLAQISLNRGLNSMGEGVDRLVQTIQKTSSFILDNIEFKQISKDSLVLFNNQENLVFPTRVWDSYQLWGSSELNGQIKKLLSEEIVQNPKMTNHFHDRLRTHKRVLKSGTLRIWGNDVQQFNLESGEFYYDPDSKLEWVKPGPLRVVQYTLALSLMRRIRDFGHPDFIHELPTNIADRLGFLLDNNLTTLSANQISEMQNIYRFFLKMYHQMQYENTTSAHTVFSVDTDTLKDIKGMMSLLTDTLTDKFFRT